MEDDMMETAENDVISEICGDTDCEPNNIGEVADEADAEEALIEEKSSANIEQAKQVKSTLKDGQNCRLKSEGEKLSKIIRKTGKANQKKLENKKAEIKTSSVEKVQGRNKRDTKLQGNAKKTKPNLNKKTEKMATAKKNKKYVDNKKINSKKSGKNNQQKKKQSKNEL
jgi:hypothetical protein